MRVKKRNASDASADVNMSPLIDMVFILLIFFIVTTVFVEENGMALSTPEIRPIDDEKGEPFVIEIRRNGALYFEDGEIAFSQLKRIVSREKAGENRTLSLYVGSRIPMDRVVSVMDHCLDAGVRGIQIKSID